VVDIKTILTVFLVLLTLVIPIQIVLTLSPEILLNLIKSVAAKLRNRFSLRQFLGNVLKETLEAHSKKAHTYEKGPYAHCV
jgi:hypothetical protein